MDTAERMLKLLSLLQSRVDWTGDELSQRLEVTPRTVRRDVGRLRELGYPVEALAGPGGGYRLGSGGKLPPLMLDDDEALAVALGLRLSAAGAVGGLEDASVSAMSKLEQVLPARLRTRLEDVSTSMVSMQSTSELRVDHGTLATVAATIRKAHRLRFGYTDRSGRETERHVEPNRLVHTGRRWYLVAFDMDREDWRTFRMDRVAEARSTLMPAASRQAPDAIEFVQRGIAVDAWDHKATVVLHVSAEQAAATIHPAMGTIEPIDESSSRMAIGADDANWIARFLVNLPFEFEVEESDELREELAALGSRLVTAFA